MARPRGGLSPQQILERAAQLLRKDKQRLSRVGRPIYRGATISPMSSLTQKARGLKSRFSQEGAPYSGEMERVLSRSNVGMDPASIQSQLQSLGQRHSGFSEDQMLGTLRKQFRESYNPRTAGYRTGRQQDIASGISQASGNLGDIGRASGVLEQTGNEQFIQALKGLQAQKQARRKGLVGTLEQFGSQKHGHTNLMNRVAQNLFNQEAGAPQKRMDMLQQTLARLGPNAALGVNPDIQSAAGEEALQALRAYGIDTSQPPEAWGENRMSPLNYRGTLVAGLTPEIRASHSTAEAMDPEFKDKLSGKREALTSQLMGDEGIGAQALAGAPERMKGAIKGLEDEAKQRLDKDLEEISHKYVQANQYGSRQHLRAAEKRAREISKATLAERNKLLQETTKSELSLGHKGKISDLRQLGLYGDSAQREYASTIDAVRDMNRLGSEKWANEQEELRDLYRNYQNAAAWEWPHTRSNIARGARSEALDEVFRGLDARGISLDQLAALNTNYSELQRENAARMSELDTRDTTIADLQRQLGLFNEQKEQEQRAEDLRRQQQQQQQDQRDESRRLQGLQGSTNALQNRWNALMQRKEALRVYDMPVGTGISQRQVDRFHEHAYPGSGRGSNIINAFALRDQMRELGQEADRAGLEPKNIFSDYETHIKYDPYK